MEHGHGYEKQVLHPPLSVLETEDHDFIALPFFSFFPAPGYIQSSLLIILSICYLSKKRKTCDSEVVWSDSEFALLTFQPYPRQGHPLSTSNKTDLEDAHTT